VIDVESRRTVVVTGASTGIGRASVAALIAEGFSVYATVRRLEDADDLREQFGDSVVPLLMDLLDEDSVRAAGAEVCASGPLFGLVNNAGAALPGPLEYLPIDNFRRQLEINLTGQLLVTQVMLPALRRSAEQAGDARIVMIGSIGGRIAGPILGAYHAAKHGLVGMTGALRAELAPFGIRVLLIEPGTIATPIWERGRAHGEELQSRHPHSFGRYAKQLQSAYAMAERGARSGQEPKYGGSSNRRSAHLEKSATAPSRRPRRQSRCRTRAPTPFSGGLPLHPRAPLNAF
jgi:NAD(P)-dependent dehydrogenase (short-subunit alcohol dehydrogenase family)